MPKPKRYFDLVACLSASPPDRVINLPPVLVFLLGNLRLGRNRSVCIPCRNSLDCVRV